jgi:hypothetical protein
VKKAGRLFSFPWWHPNSISFVPSNGEIHKIEYPYQLNGMQYEIAAFESCVENGHLECLLVKHEDSLAASGLMDNLRKK